MPTDNQNQTAQITADENQQTPEASAGAARESANAKKQGEENVEDNNALGPIRHSELDSESLILAQ